MTFVFQSGWALMAAGAGLAPMLVAEAFHAVADRPDRARDVVERRAPGWLVNAPAPFALGVAGWSAWSGVAAMPAASAVYGLGLVCVVAATAGRFSAHRSLGRFHTGTVAIRHEHTVVDDGLYRWVRHPIYATGILYFVGAGLVSGSWLGLAACGVLPTAALVWRIRVEEAVLVTHLGDAYLSYAAARPRLVPWLW